MAAFVTNTGAAWIVDCMLQAVATKPEYVGFGTGTGGAKTDTGLQAPATHEARSQDASLTDGGTYVEGSAEITCATAGKTITEAGIFDGAGAGPPMTGGVMIAYESFTGIVLAVGDKIAFTWTITITN